MLPGLVFDYIVKDLMSFNRKSIQRALYCMESFFYFAEFVCVPVYRQRVIISR